MKTKIYRQGGEKYEQLIPPVCNKNQKKILIVSGGVKIISAIEFFYHKNNCTLKFYFNCRFSNIF